MNPHRRAPRFELTPIARAIRQAGLAAFAAASITPFASLAQVPTGGTVTQGTAAIQNVSPTQQVITQGSNRAVINWQSFSIGQASSVQFVQPGAASVVLNRVTSANPSSILGSLSANGQVFLVNPYGVYFSPTARVDVTGLMATTLNIRDSDFMSGNYAFSRDPLSPANARVVNEGNIFARPGGYVVLAGDYAANRGTIEARGGSVVLASGNRMTLDLQGDGLVSLAVDEKTVSNLAAVENAGTIIADGGRVVMTAAVARDLTGTVVNNTGLVQARGTVERDGAIYLTGSGGDVSSSGKLDASGTRGGQVAVQATSGTTLVSGSVDASGSTAAGGNVQILGDRVGLVDNASVNASGATGGGTVLVGGDFQGKNPDIQNAQRTYVGPNATIVADAGQTGDGGKVVVWADGDTRYYGNISARGGAQAGNGGSAEVSGNQVLDYNGKTDLRAPAGRTGNLLLDPNDLTIQTTGPDTTTPAGVGPFTDTSNVVSSVLTVGTLQTQLGTADVTVQTGGTNLQPGNLTVANAVIAPANGSSLTLRAHNNVVLNADLNFQTNTSTGNVTVVADSDASGGGAISGAGKILMNTGSVSLSAGSGISANTAASNVSFTNTSGAVSISNTKATGITVSGTNSGTVAITETAGNLIVGAGNINSNNNTIGLTASAGTITDTGTISGSTLTTSSKGGTTLDSANAVTGFNASNNTTGNISFSNDTATTLAVTGINQTATAGAVSITHSGNVNVTGATSTSDGAVSITATGGSLTVGNTVTAGGTGRDVTLTTTGNHDISVNAAVNAAGDNITLSSGGQITGSGTLTSTGLSLTTGVGGIGSSGTPLALNVTNFEAQAPGSIFVNNAGALTIGGVSGLTGVSTTAPLASSSISIGATSLTVAEAISTTLGIAPVTLSADQFAINAGVTGGLVTLAPKTAGTNFSLGAGTTGGTAGLSQAELLNITAGLTRIGSPTVKAGNIVFDGNLALTNTQGPLSLYANGTVSQNAGTTISTPAGFAAQTSGGALTLDQTGNSFQTVAIDAGAGNVSLRNDSNFTVATVDGVKGIKGADITLTTGQTRTANLTATDTLDFGAPSGLVAGDRVRITGGGTDFVTTVQSAAGNTATISQAVTTGAIDTSVDTNVLTVASVAGLAVGDLVTIPGAGSGGGAFTSTIAAIDAPTLKVTLSTGAFNTVAAGTQVLRGRPATATVAGVTVTRLPTTATATQGSNTLNVASTNGLSVGDRIVVPGAGANGADLLTTITGTPTSTSITVADNAGTATTGAAIAKPSFIGGPSTIATGAVATGTTVIPVASTAGYSVGDAISIAGAGGSGAPHNVNVTNVDGGLGTITISAATATDVTDAVITHADQGIAASGTLTLDSKLPGGFTQVGGPVTATNLVLKGSGPYNIGGTGGANDIGTLAADVTGSIAVGDRNAVTIGTAGGISGVTTRSVLTVPAGVATAATYTDANVSISTNSDNAGSGTMLQINQPIIAGAKEPFPAADDPGDPTGAVRTGQVLLFLVNDTTATGPGQIEGGLLNLAAEVTKGTFDLTTKVSSLALSGSKNATLNNLAYTGNLTALNLGLRDISTSASVTSADNNTSTPGAGTIFTTGLIADAHAGRKLVITSGAGKDETYSIVSNTATKIVLAGPLTTIPSAGDTFKIGEDKDIRAGNVTLRTGGDIAVNTANLTGDLAISAEKFDSRATFTLLTSAGNNIFIQADRLLVTQALTTPGVNVLLRPFTTTNTVGIESATDPGMPHASTTGTIDTTVSDVTINVASSAGFFVGDPITIAGAGPAGANLVTSIAAINGNALTLNDVAGGSVTGVAVTNGAVAAGATNYTAASLSKFNAQSNITIGGDDTGATFPPTFPVGITGTPRLTGNVFIGSDGAVDLGTRNLNVSTKGNISVANLGPVANVGLVAGGAGGITLSNLNSTGTNLLFKADALSMPGAAAAYTTAAGVNVTLQPYTLTNTVGVANAIDFHNGAVGTTSVGSDMIPISNLIGTISSGDLIDIRGAGPAGANITGAEVFGRGTQIVLAAAATIDSQNVNVSTQVGFGFVTTTGSIKAGSNILLVNDASSFNTGQGITITGAGGGGGDLNTTISSLGSQAIQLKTITASTAVTDTHLGKPPAVTINTNYTEALLNDFNATAKITVSGTTTTPAGSNTLTGNIHIGSDASAANPFDIGTRTLTASTTGTVFNHTTASVTTASSGTSGTVPPGAAWTAGQNPAPGTSAGGGGGGSGNNGGSNGGNNNGNNNNGGSGPGGGPTPAGPGGNPTSGPTDGGNPGGNSTPSNPTTPGGTNTSGPTTPNPLPGPNDTPGPGGTTVIGYTDDPDPTTPPGDPTDPTIPPVVVTPPDPGTPPGDPTDPIDPTVVVVTPTDPGTPPGDPTDPTDPTVVVVAPPDPGTTPPGDTPGGTPPDSGPIATGPIDTTPPGDTPGETPTDGGPIATGPTDTTPPGGTPPGDTPGGTPTDSGPIATGPTDTTPPGDTPGGTPTDGGPIATGPTDTTPPGGTPPGDTPGGTPTDGGPIATGPTDTAPPGGTPPGDTTGGTPTDGGPIATGPTDTTPPGGTPPGDTTGGTPTDGGPIATGPTDTTPPGGTPPGDTPGGTPTDSGPIATGPTDTTPPGGTTPGDTTGGTTPDSGGPIASSPTDTTTPGGTSPGDTPGGTPTDGGPVAGGPATPGGTPDGGTTPGSGTGPVAGGPGAPGGTTTTTTSPGGTTTSTTTVTAGDGSTTTTTTVTAANGATTVTTAAADGTVTTTLADGSTTTVFPNGTTTTVLADGTTTTTFADGTTASTTGQVAAGGETGTSQASAECPPGMAPSKTDSGATGPCTATAAAPAATPAAPARVVARPISAPNTQDAPAPVFASREYGVNLFQAGRRNGPGTPDPGMRK